MEYALTLKYLLRDGDDSVDDVVERLGVAGCDDALVGIGRVGRLSLDFTREATSAEAALVSALSDVKRAVPVRDVDRIDIGRSLLIARDAIALRIVDPSLQGL